MTTLNNQNLINQRTIRSWLLALMLCGGVMIGVAMTFVIQAGVAGGGVEPSPSVLLSSAMAPMHDAREAQTAVDRPGADGDLEAARLRWLRSQQALVRLQSDSRWQEPSQREHLSRAMQDTSLSIRAYRDEVRALERAACEL